MFDSEEEYVMDFKAEENRTHLARFTSEDAVSDCTTLSASEIDFNDSDVSTPPLLYKLKKARVMIKKLPRNILAKYKINCKETPLRSSGRIQKKHIPVGKYLSLHVNKPLDVVMKHKTGHGKNVLEFVEKTKNEKTNSNPLKKNIILPSYNSMKRISSKLSRNSSTKSRKIGTLERNIGRKSNSLFSRRNVSERYARPGSRKNDFDSKASANTTTPNVDKKSTTPLKTRSLHERIAATRINYKPVETFLPQLPDVVITRYDIPPTSRNQFTSKETRNEKSVSYSMGRNSLQHDKILPEPFITSYPKSYCPQNAQSNVFPAFLTPAPGDNQSRRLMNSNATAKNAIDGSQHQIFPSPHRKFTIRAFKIPNDLSKTNEVTPVDPPRLFVVDPSLLGIDPLNTPNSGDKIVENPQRRIGKENAARNCMNQIDVERQLQPEVIKRIVYHTKSVQTKFTCNSSICGLVDSGEFNLNCFYCYEIFPLHKWLEFKEHIKIVHQVEERSNLTYSDLESDNDHSRNRQENYPKTLTPTPRRINQNVVRISTTKAVNTTPQVYEKLPLEPRLVAQRQNKMYTEPSKIFCSTPKTAKTTKIQDQSTKSKNSVKFNYRQINEIINLDSDDESGKKDLDRVKSTAKGNPQVEKKTTNSKTQSSTRSAKDSKLFLPSLPHITIKKVNVDASTTASKSMSPNAEVIKIPSTSNIQKVIKTLPKPTADQLSGDGKAKPRYFVVKKIIKLPTANEVSKASDLNIPRGSILTKMSLDSKKSADNIEDSAPKKTSGLGILFGLTNSMVVIEFLLKLKTFPELWRRQMQNIDPVKYNESIKKLCLHLNTRFGLNMTEFEMILSIQRVKDWYHLMLQSIHEHNKDPNNTSPYKHRFPIYFKILSQFLTADADEEGTRLSEIINKTALSTQASVANQIGTAAVVTNEVNTNFCTENLKTAQPSAVTATTSTNNDSCQNQEVTADSLIEFDADTLYDQESSEEEILEEFDESKFFPKKKIRKETKVDGTPRSRTKVYRGSFECDICHKVFKRSCDLKRHRVFHQPPQFECGLCSQKFYFKFMVERCTHVKQSSYVRVDKAAGEKRIWPKKVFRFNMICEICGNSYRSIGSLNTHKKDKHFNQRDTCIVCNFTALSNWRIIQHQRKRHIVEPGLPEDIAKKTRARTESKSTFSNEARQAFDWRREMRKKMKPGEKFFGCCRCKIIFNTRKEKVLHNKTEHPITEFTVFCLLCLPNKLLLSNSNGARRHYIDIHKVPWHEIDGLVKCTKPIFNLLNQDEIELLKASENYKELLEELLKDKKLQSVEHLKMVDDEASKAVENLPHIKELDDESAKIEVECTEEQNVYVDSMTETDHYIESDNYKPIDYACINEHNYSEEHVMTENFNELDQLIDNDGENELYSQESCEEGTVQMNAVIQSNECRMEDYIQNDHEYVQNIVEDELIEESIVVEEYMDEIIGEDEGEYV